VAKEKKQVEKDKSKKDTKPQFTALEKDYIQRYSNMGVLNYKRDPTWFKTKVKLFRYDPTKEARPHYEEYEVPYEEGARIYTVLKYIREELGKDVAYRVSCRQRMCGGCAVTVNGEPKLICWDEALPEMTIEPLDNFPVVRDLVIDRKDYDLRMGRVPRLERIASPRSIPREIKAKDFEVIPPTDMNPYAWICIECLACTAACPVTKVALGRFAGPAIINKIAQFAFDPRDKMARMPDAFFAEIYDCTTCRKCEEVCPVKIAMPNRMEITIEKLRELMTSQGVGPYPEHIEFANEAKKTGRVIVKREKTLLESIPEEVVQAK
jgi:fumarate reductase (CoM/CoB) subunit B